MRRVEPMRRWVGPGCLGIAVAFAVIACRNPNQPTRTFPEAGADEPPRTPPELIIKEGEVYFEGRHLPLGGPVRLWKDVLGAGRAVEPESGDYGSIAWDQVGLMVIAAPRHSKRPEPVVRGLNVVFDDHVAEGPRKPFGGTFLLDGTRVHRDMGIFPRARPCHFQKGHPLPDVYECDAGDRGYGFIVTQEDKVRYFQVEVDNLWGEPIPRDSQDAGIVGAP